MLKEMLDCFIMGKEEGCEYIGIRVKMERYEGYEIIINPICNADKKIEYYKNAYNEDLTLKNAPNAVKIVDFTYGNSIQEIEMYFNSVEGD